MSLLFQGGPFVEIFTAQGKDPTHGWKVGPSGIKREYEKDVKGFLYCLEGSTTTTKMQLPKSKALISHMYNTYQDKPVLALLFVVTLCFCPYMCKTLKSDVNALSPMVTPNFKNRQV